jgi:hypothetical protein
VKTERKRLPSLTTALSTPCHCTASDVSGSGTVAGGTGVLGSLVGGGTVSAGPEHPEARTTRTGMDVSHRFI